MEAKVQNAYVWVIRGSQRITILKALDRPLTPSLLKKRTGIKITNISDVLREMVSHGLVEVLNPKDSRNRVYSITSLGTEVRNYVLDI